MSDPYRRARPGDDLAIPASTWNTAIDAAKAYRDRTGAVGGSETPRSGWIVPVLNDTGGDLPRASVVGLAGPIFPPSVSLDAFLQGAAFRGVVPDATHANRFAVTLVPIRAGQVGRAFVSGVFQTRIEILDESHTCAHASEGDTEKLVSGSGPAQILWKESGTGTKWAIVRRVGSCGPLPEPPDLQWCCNLRSTDADLILTVLVAFGGSPSVGGYTPTGTYPLRFANVEYQRDFGAGADRFDFAGFITRRFRWTGLETSYLGDEWDPNDCCEIADGCYVDCGSPGDFDKVVTFSYSDVSPNACVLGLLSCDGRYGGPEFGVCWREMRWTHYSTLTATVVSCDPLLIEFKSGSTVHATITRA